MHNHVCHQCNHNFPCNLIHCKQQINKLCYNCIKAIEDRYNCGMPTHLLEDKNTPFAIDKKLCVIMVEQKVSVRQLYDWVAALGHVVPYYDYVISGRLANRE